ncbi:MAG: disulfide bond formation protein B [Patescibacteria group bacterium]
MFTRIKSWLSEYGVYIAWVVTLVSLVGSLYFSEIAGIAPCALCWYQRIVMYPLVVIMAVGIIRRDKAVSAYVLPLSIIGLGIALYQNLLIWRIIPETLAPCTVGVSCISRQFTVLNFITIPLLSLIAFTLITGLMFVHRSAHRDD